MTLEEAIQHCEEVAEENEKKLKSWGRHCLAKIEEQTCLECAEEHRQLAEWLRELKAYKELDTYNRSSKCSECEFEDSAYYCDDCIWNYVNKFEQRQVKVDEKESEES